MTRRGTSLVIATLLLLQGPPARTAPLDKDVCTKLKAEQAELEHLGARGNMAKGPQWAKANLEPDKLEHIRRLLEVDEQLLFRCHGKPLVNLPRDPDPDPAAKEPGAPVAKGPKRQKKEAVKAAATPAEQQPAAKDAPAAKKASSVPKAAPDKAEGGANKKSEQKSAAAKKAKAKAKSDDAYRPPASEPGANPFSNQAPKP